jgi:hypothetical protein
MHATAPRVGVCGATMVILASGCGGTGTDTDCLCFSPE